MHRSNRRLACSKRVVPSWLAWVVAPVAVLGCSPSGSHFGGTTTDGAVDQLADVRADGQGSVDTSGERASDRASAADATPDADAADRASDGPSDGGGTRDSATDGQPDVATDTAPDGGTTSPVGGIDSLGGACPGRWCWYYPRPEGALMGAIWADPQGGIWIGGQQGAILRWDRSAWRFLPVEVANQEDTLDVSAIWGSADDDVWACAGSLFHFDGTAWSLRDDTLIPPPPYQTLSSSCLSVSGTAADDVWMGSDSAIYHWDGAVWTGIPDFVGHRIYVMAAVSKTEVWAIVDDGSGLARWDGAVWTRVTWPTANPVFEDVWVRRPGDVWLVVSEQLWHGDGSTFEMVPGGMVQGGTRQVFGSATGDDVYIIDARPGQNAISQRTGAGGGPTSIPYDGSIYPKHGTVSPSGDVWVTGQGGQLWQLRNGRFTFVTPSVTSGLLSDIRGIWSDGNGTVLAAGGTYYRSVAGIWQTAPKASDVTSANGMWARSATDAWAVGGAAGVFHYDGVSWSRVATGVTATQAANLQLFAIGGTDSGELWAVGQGGQTLHFDGQAWQLGATQASQELDALWIESADEIWACGKGGAVERWTRQGGWSAVARPFTVDCHGIWGRSDSEVWIVETSAIYRYDGQGWTPFNVAVEGGRTYNAIAGLPNGELWTASDSGVLLHWNGIAFERERTDLRWNLLSLSIDANGGVWTAGQNETVLYRRP